LSTIDLHLSGMTGALTMRLNHPAIVKPRRRSRRDQFGKRGAPAVFPESPQE
jgi:hypothetical protein